MKRANAGDPPGLNVPPRTRRNDDPGSGSLPRIDRLSDEESRPYVRARCSRLGAFERPSEFREIASGHTAPGPHSSTPFCRSRASVAGVATPPNGATDAGRDAPLGVVAVTRRGSSGGPSRSDVRTDPTRALGRIARSVRRTRALTPPVHWEGLRALSRVGPAELTDAGRGSNLHTVATTTHVTRSCFRLTSRGRSGAPVSGRSLPAHGLRAPTPTLGSTAAVGRTARRYASNRDARPPLGFQAYGVC